MEQKIEEMPCGNSYQTDRKNQRTGESFWIHLSKFHLNIKQTSS